MTHWQELGPGAWSREYHNKFAGEATCFAFSIGGDKLAVLSPSQDTPAAAFEELDKLGAVVALIAPGGHDLGQPEWQARYPNAGTYAPQPTIPSLAKKSSLRPFQPLSSMQIDDARVKVVDGPGSKSGSALVRVGKVAYIDEIIGSNPKMPPSKLFALLFWLTGSAPGLKLNKFYGMAFCSDKKALANAVLGVLDGADVAVPAHGPPIRGADVDTARSFLRMIA